MRRTLVISVGRNGCENVVVSQNGGRRSSWYVRKVKGRERVRARRYGASIIEWLVREGGAVGAASVVIGVGSGVNV